MVSYPTVEPNRLASHDSLGVEQPPPATPEPTDNPLVSVIRQTLLQLPEAPVWVYRKLEEAQDDDDLLKCARACMTLYLKRRPPPERPAAGAWSVNGAERSPTPSRPERPPPRRDRRQQSGRRTRRTDRRPAKRARDREIIKMTGVALGDHDLHDGAFRTLSQLVGLCGSKGWCETNWRALATLLGVCPKTVQRHIRLLVELGYLKHDRPPHCRWNTRIALAEALIPPKKAMPRDLRTLIDGWRSRRPEDRDIVERAVRAFRWNRLSPDERAMARRRRCGTPVSHPT